MMIPGASDPGSPSSILNLHENPCLRRSLARCIAHGSTRTAYFRSGIVRSNAVTRSMNSGGKGAGSVVPAFT